MWDFRHMHIKTAQVPKSTDFDAIKCLKKLRDYSNRSGKGQKTCMHQKIDKKICISIASTQISYGLGIQKLTIDFH